MHTNDTNISPQGLDIKCTYSSPITMYYWDPEKIKNSLITVHDLQDKNNKNAINVIRQQCLIKNWDKLVKYRVYLIKVALNIIT